MNAFLAIILNMGLIELPNIHDYWSTSWVSEVPFFSGVMSRSRFTIIFWLLHVSHEREGGTSHRLDKVRSMLELLIPKFQSSYMPSQNISVDETMVGFRGRFVARQYIPTKPQYGINAFTMADADHGYLLNILVYTGADTLVDADPSYSHLPQLARIVLHLLSPYLDKGHHVYTDRYYTSLPLADTLASHSTAFTGTTMRNRQGLPDAIRKPLG